MEGGLIEQRRNDVIGYTNGSKKLIKKRKMRKKSCASNNSANINNMKMKKEIIIPISLKLQQVYSCCKSLFKGPGIVPPPQDVQSLCNILDTLEPQDFGLNENIQFFKPGNCVKGNPRVRYTTVYQCPNFSLVLLFLPEGSVIPLHNHPEMTVFNKLLLGKMHIKAYDWANFEHEIYNSQNSSSRLARLKADHVFNAPSTASVLFPTSGGNIHEFTAVTPCAVLDVMGPPYSKEDGRDCSYYKEIVFPFSDEKLVELKEDEYSYGLLEEIEMPENSKMNGIEYLGPRIIESDDD